MIRVSVLYPNEPGKKFDYEYFVTKHLYLVKSNLGSALVFGEGNKGLSGGAPGSPAPFVGCGPTGVRLPGGLSELLRPPRRGDHGGHSQLHRH